ncbi:MAG TPA: hypothetical protein VEP90_11715, partial [Methylomirabilota bacterium]|nr:hypothetical protein [Methylomirabilota bacterium]
MKWNILIFAQDVAETRRSAAFTTALFGKTNSNRVKFVGVFSGGWLMHPSSRSQYPGNYISKYAPLLYGIEVGKRIESASACTEHLHMKGL